VFLEKYKPVGLILQPLFIENSRNHDYPNRKEFDICYSRRIHFDSLNQIIIEFEKSFKLST